ncbi:MAG: IclR family transcriptional regulator [Rhizobiales bacterium]|nr:IclR family transcriptional regulator [Hyphomicrobiales bacterium]
MRAVERSIALLRAFRPGRTRQTLTELASTTALDKNTTRRLLHTLEAGGLVEHQNGLYALSYGLLELFSAVDTGRPLREIAGAVLPVIAAETSATAFLWVHKDGMAVCVERVRPPQSLVEVTWSAVGSRTTLNSGGGPQALLGHLPPAELKRALDQDLARRTPFTIADREALAARAAEIAKDGHVLAVDDYVVGLSALGVPVFDRHRQLLGAISISTLGDHARQLVASGYFATLESHAAEIGRRVF